MTTRTKVKARSDLYLRALYRQEIDLWMEIRQAVWISFFLFYSVHLEGGKRSHEFLPSTRFRRNFSRAQTHRFTWPCYQSAIIRYCWLNGYSTSKCITANLFSLIFPCCCSFSSTNESQSPSTVVTLGGGLCFFCYRAQNKWVQRIDLTARVGCMFRPLCWPPFLWLGWPNKTRVFWGPFTYQTTDSDAVAVAISIFAIEVDLQLGSPWWFRLFGQVWHCSFTDWLSG